MGLPRWVSGKVSDCNAGDMCSCKKESHSSSCLGNPMDGGTWGTIVYGAAKSQT